MKTNQSYCHLHCLGVTGHKGMMWGGGRPRAHLEAEVMPVHGPLTLFSLALAGLAAGLMPEREEASPWNWATVYEKCKNPWGRSIHRFLAEAAQRGATREAIDRRAAAFSGAVIGWSFEAWHYQYERPIRVCPDLIDTLAVLSRSAGNIFIAAREPDFSWENLFGRTFAVDEPMVPAIDLASPPWSEIPWIRRELQ